MSFSPKSIRISTAALATIAASSMLWLTPSITNATPTEYDATFTANSMMFRNAWVDADNWDVVPTAGGATTHITPNNSSSATYNVFINNASNENIVLDNFIPTVNSISITGQMNDYFRVINGNTLTTINDFSIQATDGSMNGIFLNNTNSTIDIGGNLNFSDAPGNTFADTRLSVNNGSALNVNNDINFQCKILVFDVQSTVTAGNINFSAGNKFSDIDISNGGSIIVDDDNDSTNISNGTIHFDDQVQETSILINPLNGNDGYIRTGTLQIDRNTTNDNNVECILYTENQNTVVLQADKGIKIESKVFSLDLNKGTIQAGDEGVIIGKNVTNKADATVFDTFDPSMPALIRDGAKIITTGNFECYANGIIDLGNSTIQAANINKYHYDQGTSTSYDPGQWLTIHMMGGNLIATGTVTDGSPSDARIEFNKEMSVDRYDQLIGHGNVTAGYIDSSGTFHPGTIMISNYAGIQSNITGETLTFNGNLQVMGVENLDTDPANDRFHPYSLYASNGGHIVINGDAGYQGVYIADAGSSITINGDLKTEVTTINGNIIVNGSILNDIGSEVTIKNEFSLQDSTTLVFDIMRPSDQFIADNSLTSNTQSGLFTLTDGSVMNLDGTLRVNDVTALATNNDSPHGQFAVGDEFTFIQAGEGGNGTGSLEGSFDNIYLPTETNGVMLKIDLNTDDTDNISDYLKLIAEQAGISPTITPTSSSMTQTMSAIDSAAQNNAAFNVVVTDILNLPTSQKQQAAVQSLQQNNVQSVAATSQNLASSNASAMHSRFNNVSQGQVFAFNPTSNQPNQQLAASDQEPTDYMLMISEESANLTGSPVFDWFNNHSGGIFLTSSFTHIDHNSTANQVGFESHQSDFLIGGDFLATDDLRVGAAIGYAYVTTDNLNSLGSSETNALNTQIYANYYAAPNLRIDATLGYTYADYQLERNLFSGDTAFGNTHNNQFTAEIGANLLIPETPIENLILTPFAYLRYTNSNIAGYTETEAGALGLKVDSQSSDSLTSSIGTLASFKYELSNSVLEPFISASFEHQFIDQDRTSSVSFIGDPSTPFDAFIDATDENYVNLSVGSLWALSDKLMLRATFDTTLFHDELDANRLSAGLRINF
ncbi:autotransporter domain-containing protein [Planctomycetota bacterium]|nr:autotransporter domain-containing protein [Planctomycetota bacterium]